MRLRGIVVLALALAVAPPQVRIGVEAAQAVPTPEQFFGFRPGADGELARYPKVLEYFQLIAKSTDRVKYEELGKTTMGNSYALVRISSPQNLARFDRLVEINRRLADPRGLSDAEAQKLSAEGKPFYLLYATIHSNEVSNGTNNNDPWSGRSSDRPSVLDRPSWRRPIYGAVYAVLTMV